MKKKNKKFLWIGGAVVLAIAVFFILGVQQSVLGVSETIDWGDSRFDFNDGIAGSGTAIGFLTLPANTTNFAFVVDYNLKTIYKSSTTGRANVKYEIFNYQTNAWETIHDKSWSIGGCSTCTNTIDFDGDTVYENGIPEHIVASLVSSGLYDKYFGCLNGMTVEEAKTLNVWIEGTSTYRYYCMYPDTYQKEWDYRDASDNYDYVYFPPLIVKNTNYIGEGNKVQFRVTYNPISGLRSKDEGDFRVHLWKVETLKMNVWAFENGTCNKREIYTYQGQATDYFTENECKVANNLTVIEPPIEPPIEPECQGVCDIVTGDVITETPAPEGTVPCDTCEPKSNFKLYFFGGLGLFALIVIFIIVKRRRK